MSFGNSRSGLFAAISVSAFFFPVASWASFSDLKFGQAQIADSQWNTSTCIVGDTCQIFSMNPGVAYRFPFTDGLVEWSVGDYISFAPNELYDPESSDSNSLSFYQWVAVQYDSEGEEKETIGVANVTMVGTSENGDSYFFMVGPNTTGQLFSGSRGLDSTAGLIFEGTLNPDVDTLNTASLGLATTPLLAGETVASEGNTGGGSDGDTGSGTGDDTGSGSDGDTAGGSGPADPGTVDTDVDPGPVTLTSLLDNILADAAALSASISNIAQNLNDIDGSITIDVERTIAEMAMVIDALKGMNPGFGAVSQVNAGVYASDLPASLLAVLNPLTLELGNLSTTAIGTLQSGNMTAAVDADGLLGKVSSAAGTGTVTTASMLAEQVAGITGLVAMQNLSLNSGVIDATVNLALNDVNTKMGAVSTTAIGALQSGSLNADIAGAMGLQPDQLVTGIVHALVGCGQDCGGPD